MLTYELKKSPGVPLYEALYRCIRADILSGSLAADTKLPSKRALAQNLEVSKITVEAAYNQLLSEGYIRSQEKVGYFVEKVARPAQSQPVETPKIQPRSREYLLDLTSNGTEQFPFSVWSKLQREVMLDYGEKLLLPLPNQGIPELRQAIAEHLAAFRGMHVDPENILIGAGTDFLYNLLIQLLGRDKIYAVEEPGYGKIRKIYGAGGVRCISAPMDSRGVRPDRLSDAQVLHFSPSHHFPTGLITPVSRRAELLAWAVQNDGYIIEDDYDSEFRYASRPIPAMQSLDDGGKVIYVGTFSRSIAPSIRVAYLVLPRRLLPVYEQRLGFAASTVSRFEQQTLAAFLQRGLYGRHLRRAANLYRKKQQILLEELAKIPGAQVWGAQAGLHFLLTVPGKSEEWLVAQAAKAGVPVRGLSSYCRECDCPESTLVLGFAGLQLEDIPAAAQTLREAFEDKIQNS